MTPRTRLLTLAVSPADFFFHAGQAVWIRQSTHAARNPYSIASSPSDLVIGGVLEFLVGLDESAMSAGHHLDGLAAGSSVEIEGPMGGFDLPHSIPSAPVLLVAGGTGIAPLRSMWRELIAHPDASSMSVVFSARSARNLPFLSELRALERNNRIRFAVTITGKDEEWDGARGRLTREVLAEHLTSPLATRCAICGPAAFVSHVVQILTALGVPAVHIATERW
jgi:CDP-4-dehydro-6-deoxyglucose reductase